MDEITFEILLLIGGVVWGIVALIKKWLELQVAGKAESLQTFDNLNAAMEEMRARMTESDEREKQRKAKIQELEDQMDNLKQIAVESELLSVKHEALRDMAKELYKEKLRHDLGAEIEKDKSDE